MKNTDSVSILASFATLKTLSDGKRYNSAYQLLSEFIHYVIYTEKLYSFSAIEMKNWLYNIFGFYIPEAVVKTATRALKYLVKENGIYNVSQDQLFSDRTLENAREEEYKKNSFVIEKLKKFIVEKEPNTIINEEQLTRELMTYLVGESSKSSDKYSNLISEFIIKKEKDSLVQECLNKIREGTILYMGLTCNIYETGSFKKQLTLYLDTEILFSLVGYNGEIHKTLAQDFFNQVKAANMKGEKIKLTYFKEVEKEINSYFNTAISIVEGKTQIVNKPAMKAIINGCKTSSDINIQKSDFYHMLNYSFGIHNDKKEDYYTEQDKPFNLESEEYTEPKNQESWLFISHINKLRKAQLYTDNTEAEYLFITNTSNTLKLSREYSAKLKEQNKLENICDYAINLDRITNIIWYKLGNGFGKKEFPSNVNAILSARIALASCITHNVEYVYADIKEQFKNGLISAEQLAARILTLRKKPILPEELERDSIEDSMDFSTEYLSRFEEEIKESKSLIEEKNRVIKDLAEQNKLVIKKKDEIIAEHERIIESQREEKNAIKAELEIYHQKEELARKRKMFVKNIARFIWAILWKTLIIFGIALFALFIEKKINSNIPRYIAWVIEPLGIIYTIWSAIRKDFHRCLKSKEEYNYDSAN